MQVLVFLTEFSITSSRKSLGQLNQWLVRFHFAVHKMISGCWDRPPIEDIPTKKSQSVELQDLASNCLGIKRLGNESQVLLEPLFIEVDIFPLVPNRISTTIYIFEDASVFRELLKCSQAKDLTFLLIDVFVKVIKRWFSLHKYGPLRTAVKIIWTIVVANDQWVLTLGYTVGYSHSSNHWINTTTSLITWYRSSRGK